MISRTLQTVMTIAVLMYFILLVILLKKKRLLLKYSLLWMFAGLIMLIMIIFPGMLDRISAILGIYSPVNALFAMILFCIIILLVSLTAIVSSQNEKIKRLIQREAILDEEIRTLKDKGDSNEHISAE